jgi:hypothetical protein
MRFRAVAVAVMLLCAAARASATVLITAQPLTAVFSSGTQQIAVADSASNGVFQQLLGQPRNFTQGASGVADAVEMSDAIEAVGPAGELALTATEAIGADAAAAAIVGCAATVVCGVGGAAAIGGALYLNKMHNDAEGNIWQDPSQPATLIQTNQWLGDGTAPNNVYGSASAACESYGQYLPSGYTVSTIMMGATSARCDSVSDGVDRGQFGGTSMVTQQQHQCPSIDLSGDPGQPFPDGTCPTPQANNKLLDQADAAAAMNTPAAPLAPSAVITAAVSAAVAGGMSVIGTGLATSGPASQQGPSTTTTTTNPDGSSSTVTSQPQYKYDYQPDHVGVETDTSTSTTVKDATGNTVSTNTGTTVTNPNGTGTGTGTGTPGTGTGTSATPDLCSDHPGVLACDTLGTPGTDGPTWGTQNVTFAPEDIGMPSGCPAPRTFTVRGIVFVLNYQPACDVAPVVNGALVAFCALGCMIWVVAQVRS